MRVALGSAALMVLMCAQGFAATPEVKPGRKPAASKLAPVGNTRLSPDEIKATFFNGQPFIASTPAGVRYKMAFQPDGKMTREPDGKTGAKGEGAWSLSKDGFCTTWKGSKQNCYRLFAGGDNKWSVTNGSSALATWSK